MMALSGSLGSTSPMICPLMRSYAPTVPKLLPSKVGDSVFVMTIWVTRACTDGAPMTTHINEVQQAMAVVAIGVLVMHSLPRGRRIKAFGCLDRIDEDQVEAFI